MTDLSQQTEQLLKALATLHDDLYRIYLGQGMIAVLLVALILIVAFKRPRIDR